MMLYPLRFEPILRRYLWGGRRLQAVLGRNLPPGDDYAESWEICDRGADQSVVSAGALRGMALHAVLEQYPHELMGIHAGCARFPLLLKLIDAQRDLSVQVHPDDARAAKLQPPDLGKNEAWLVLHIEPGSVIYAGLKADCTRESFVAALAAGNVDSCLHTITPRVGDCVYIPAGAVHALGTGIMIAEIQQSSDVTYRLFDWNRVGADGRPRALHLEAGLEASDFELGPVDPVQGKQHGSQVAERLVDGPSFILDRLTLQQPQTIAKDETCRILIVLDGALSVAGDAGQGDLQRGDSLLIPATWPMIEVQPRGSATVLLVSLPQTA